MADQQTPLFTTIPIHPAPTNLGATSASPPTATSQREPATMTVAQIDVAALRMKHNLKQTESKINSIQTLETRLNSIIQRVQTVENQAFSGGRVGGSGKNEKENEPVMGVVTRRRAKAAAKTEVKSKEAEMKVKEKKRMELSQEAQEEVDAINQEIKGIREEIEFLEEELFRGEDKENAEWTKKIVDGLVGESKE